MTQSIPQSSAAILLPRPKISASDLRKIYQSNLLARSLPCYSRFANRPSSATSRYLNSLNDFRHLKLRASEQNLIDYENDEGSHQMIVISNQTGKQTNQIILKSSFSDQSLTTNINADSKKFNCSLQYSNEPIAQNYIPSQCEQVANNKINSSNLRRRKLPAIPIRNTQSLYIPNTQNDSNFLTLQSSPSRFAKSYSTGSNGSYTKCDNSIGRNMMENTQQESSNELSFHNQDNKPYNEYPSNTQFDFDSDSQFNSNTQYNNFNAINSYISNQFEPTIPLNNQYNANNFNSNTQHTQFNQNDHFQRERSYSRDGLKLDLKINKPAESLHLNPIDTIGSIIDSVRSQMMISKDLSTMSLEERRSSLKMELEGKVFSQPKVASPIAKNENKLLKEKRSIFQKCRSRSSQESKSSLESKSSDGEEVVDEVFVESKKSTIKKERNSSFNGKEKSKSKKNLRSSSFEGSHKNKPLTSSSVYINENPEYHSYSPKLTKSSKIASSNAIAKLNTKPSRGSLKKTSSTSSTKKSSSDYGRSTRGGGGVDGIHRDSFKKNDRINDRETASDREQKDRSTDLHSEDRIGK